MVFKRLKKIAEDISSDKDITNRKMFDEMSDIFVDNYDWPDEY